MSVRTYLVVIMLWSSACSQEHSSVSQTTRPDSCNVVCNCGLTDNCPKPDVGSRQQKASGESPQMDTSIVGLPVGPKGQKGSRGTRGETGYDNYGKLKSDVLGALSVTSCGELADQHGITTAGYYLMRSPTGDSTYTYCDFQVYSDSATCEELQTRHLITRAGYYRVGGSSLEDNFRFCQPIFRDIFTCNRLQVQHGVVESGFYFFAAGEQDPFRVYCNFTSGTVTTEVHHHMMKEVEIQDPCEAAGCYTVMPLYDVNMTHIRQIIDNSIWCKQFIKLRCRGVTIRGTAWWNSYNGEKMEYWGGTTRNGYCACGETNTCIKRTDKCNCDNNYNDIVTSDEGYLTDKSKLPLKEMRVGDLEDWNEIAWHTIGKLECVGQV